MNDLSTNTVRAVVLLSGAIEETAFRFLDVLRIREEAVYLTTSEQLLGTVRHYAKQAEILTIASFLDQRSQRNHDLLYIPGPVDATDVNPASVASVIQSLYGEDVNVIATGRGRVFLVASGLLKERLASSASLDVVDAAAGSVRAWEEDDIIRDGPFWTANDAADTLSSLAFLYKAARRSALFDFPLRTFRKHFAGGDSSTYTAPPLPPPSTTPGEDLAKTISGLSPSEAPQIALWVIDLVIRLGLEGFMSAGNSVILTLLNVFPNAYECLGSATIDLEHVWQSSGQRPAVPWEAPSEEQLDSLDREQREILHKFPPKEDKEDIFESIKLRISPGGDEYLAPYTLSGAITMALDTGRETEARRWMSTLVRNIVNASEPMLWRCDIARWRALTSFALTGIVAEITGRTAKQAEQDAAAVRQALLSFHKTSRAVQQRQYVAAQKFRNASWDKLVPMLEVLRWENHETLLKPPAPETAVREAEERLVIELPHEYKQFLLVSNGIEFMPIASAPGFRRVEDLQWLTAEELGLEEFRVDLGCKTDPPEYERLPKLGRVLMISDKNDEEMLWYIHPTTVAEAMRILKAEGRLNEMVGHESWRLIFWTSWMSDLRWLKSFHGYVEGLARKAEKLGAKMED